MRVILIENVWMNYHFKVSFFATGVSLSGIVWNVCTSVCKSFHQAVLFRSFSFSVSPKQCEFYLISMATSMKRRSEWGRCEDASQCDVFLNFFFILAYHHGATHIHRPVLSQLCACHKHIPNGWQIPAERGINSNLDRLPWTKHFYRESSEEKHWMSEQIQRRKSVDLYSGC